MVPPGMRYCRGTYSRYADKYAALHGSFAHHGGLAERLLVASTSVCGARVISGGEAVKLANGRGNVGSQERAGLWYFERKLGLGHGA